MVVYRLYLYIIVGYTREIPMCCISTVEEWVKEFVISCKVETYNGDLQNQFPSPTLWILDRLICELCKLIKSNSKQNNLIY